MKTLNCIKQTKRISKSIFFVIFMFLFLTGFADDPLDGGIESVKITGTVQDEADKESLPYATIVIYKKSDSTMVQGTVADYEGNFSLNKIPDGEYYIEINFLGYDKKIIHDITIKKGVKNIDLGTVLIKRAAENIEEVEILGEKDAVEYKLDKKVINVDKKIVAAGGTVVDAMENTPSIQVDAEGNVTLRGSSDFTVLIDGKPTALSGNDALKGIPASTVETIEIITNPSVKYDPDGTSGIINILMKKGYQTGVNGIINASIGTGLKYSGDFTLNYRTDKVNYFFSGTYSDRPMYPIVNIYNETYRDDTLHVVTQDMEREQRVKSYNIKGGADLYLSDKNTLTFSGEYGFWGLDLLMNALVEEYTEPSTTHKYLYSPSDLSIGGNYINGSVIFDHDFAKDHDLVTTFTYSTWDGTTTSELNEQTTDENRINIYDAIHYISTRNDLNQDMRFKTDYTTPVGEKSKIEAGLQARFFTLGSSYSLRDQDFDTQEWSDNEEFQNEMDFSRNISSAYLTFSSNFKGFQYQLGLRGEYTDRSMHVLTSDDLYELNRFDYFPSVHISKQLKKGQQIQASYSRRINRPQAWNLNPFPIFSDSYITQGGNPELLPEYTDSYELNYMKRFKIGFAAFEGFYRQTNNNYDMNLILQDDGLVNIKTVNLDRSFAYGTELSGNFQFTKWLSVYASANLYSYNIEGDIVTEFADVRSFKSDFVVNTNLSLSKTTRLQLTGFYNAPTITSQGLRSEMYGMNAAISQSFFKRKLSISLRGRNVLNTMKFKFEAESPGIKTNFVFNMEYPVIMLNLSYKINNYKKRSNDPETETNFGGGVL